MLNSVGLANPGLEVVRQRDLPWLVQRLSRARILVNVVGFVESEYAEVVSGLDDLESIAGFEINLSCPNTSAGGVEFGAECRVRRAGHRRLPTRHAEAGHRQALAGAARHRLHCPAAVDAGADGVSVVNTMPGTSMTAIAPGSETGTAE
jgi:dihydroorotate dehydrogenase (NAD+) catalytic subunit